MIEAISLFGKVVVVTGGARGIGQSIVRLSKQYGAQVVCCDLPSEEDSAPLGGKNLLILTGDVSREDDCDQFIEHTLKHFGRIDVLVNNAGILEPSRPTVKQEIADWKRVIDVNLQGTYMMSRAAARHMTEKKIHGSIINISSVVGLSGFRAQNAYGASKAAVTMLTKTLSADLARHKIRVNAVAPGFINTAMTGDLGNSTRIHKDAFIQRIPQGRFGEPAEIAQAVVFLASDWASYITGAILPVDGGWSAFGGPGERETMAG